MDFVRFLNCFQDTMNTMFRMNSNENWQVNQDQSSAGIPSPDLSIDSIEHLYEKGDYVKIISSNVIISKYPEYNAAIL